jgi:hypothetical protein
MKYLHTLFFALFFVLVIAFIIQQRKIYQHTGQRMSIYALEMAPADKLPAIFAGWSAAPIHDHTIFDEARSNTRVDFLFIVCYVGVLVIVSYKLLQRQKNPILNDLLRLCILLAFVAGILDAVENVILLGDFTRFANGEGPLHSAAIVAIPKWILLLLIILCWVIALLTSIFKKQSSHMHPKNPISAHILLPVIFMCLFCSCASTKVVTEYDAADAFSLSKDTTVWHYFWGLKQAAPLRPDCDPSFNYLSMVRVRTTPLQVILSFVTLGIVLPQRISWSCAVYNPEPGHPGEPSPSHP